MITRPAPDEFAPFYAPYIGALEDEDVLDAMQRGLEAMTSLLESVPRDREEFRYAPGKWSVREAVGHILDGERVFATRALTFARGDEGPLPSFDENVWARHSNAGGRPLGDLAGEFSLLRRANIVMARSLPDEALMRRGTASGQSVTVRAVLWILAGHEAHHRRVIAERYLGM